MSLLQYFFLHRCMRIPIGKYFYLQPLLNKLSSSFSCFYLFFYTSKTTGTYSSLSTDNLVNLLESLLVANYKRRKSEFEIYHVSL